MSEWGFESDCSECRFFSRRYSIAYAYSSTGSRMVSATETFKRFKETDVLKKAKTKVLPYRETSSSAAIRARIRFDFFMSASSFPT